MTQHFIRKNAGWSWPKRFLANLHEPPYISVLYGIWYLILTTVGTYSAFNPPITIVTAVGPVAPVTATLLALAGALGVVTVASGDAWLEKFAVWLGIIAWTTYLGVSAWLWLVTAGNRGMATLGIIAGLFVTGLRFHWIWRISFSEAKKRRLERKRLNQAHQQ